MAYQVERAGHSTFYACAENGALDLFDVRVPGLRAGHVVSMPDTGISAIKVNPCNQNHIVFGCDRDPRAVYTMPGNDA